MELCTFGGWQNRLAAQGSLEHCTVVDSVVKTTYHGQDSLPIKRNGLSDLLNFLGIFCEAQTPFTKNLFLGVRILH